MNEISVFNYQGNDVRTVLREDEPWWVLKDVCTALGIENYRNVAARLDEDEKGVHQMDTLGGVQDITIINESGLYRIILRSDKLEAKRFQRWVTHEVLPAIRRHGGYLTAEKLEEAMNDPDVWIRMLTALKEEREKNAALASVVGTQNRQIAELSPKAGYYDVVLACKDAVAITTIAKDYGKSGVWLNRLLRAFGVQYKQGDIWLLYQEYAEKGYTCSRTIPYLGSAGERHSKVHTYWTQAGRLFLYGLLRERGYLPLVEQRLRREAR